MQTIKRRRPYRIRTSAARADVNEWKNNEGISMKMRLYGVTWSVIPDRFDKTAFNSNFPSTFNTQSSRIQEPSSSLFTIHESPHSTEKSAEEESFLREEGRGKDMLEKTNTCPGCAYRAGNECRCSEEALY